MPRSPKRRVQTIQAAVLRQGMPLTIEELQLEGPRDDETLVRIVASGICHTDIGYCENGVSDAVVLGHEGAGVVAEVGNRIKGIKPGDHVVLSYASCGRCEECADGRPAHCEYFWKLNFGFARLDGTNAITTPGVRGHFFGQSSFATHAIVAERNLVKVDKALPLELLAPLGCGLQTGAGTVINSLAVKRRASIAIFGSGAVGLAALMAARVVGATPIIAVDIIPKRLRLARELGATHCIDNRKTDLAKSILKIAGGRLDHLIDTTGEANLVHLAGELLSPGGRSALLAGGTVSHHLPGGREVLGVIQGDAVPQRFIPYLIKLYQSGQFPFDRLIKQYDFGDINHAISDAQCGRALKPVLRMGALHPQCFVIPHFPSD